MSFVLAKPIDFPGEVVKDTELRDVSVTLEPDELDEFEGELERIACAEREAAEESDLIKLA